VAVRGAIIYFVMAGMSVIDPMYQYSLLYFKRLFNQCLKDAPAASSVEERIGNLISYQVRWRI
jgi:dynein heavy chain